MSLIFKINTPITAKQFIELLHQSTLAERRPVDDLECMQGMVENSNLIISAWDNDTLVGIARAMTDFHYACYVSDLAVHKYYQKQGIGRKLLHLTQGELGSKCKLILISAPDANGYYEQLDLNNNPRCWVLEPDQHINS
ncbi:MAG: GNAT family N-acetyltransferase [Gammaproteobacteria bacterium]|nr:GNAT family N-acetyltransferase [Gammaproteobacteria bacterium]